MSLVGSFTPIVVFLLVKRSTSFNFALKITGPGGFGGMKVLL
jgi:hypothetical protein